MKDPWEKAYVYGRIGGGRVAHIFDARWPLCEFRVRLGFKSNHTPKPYPVCRNCLRTKRAKELGLK